LNKVDVIAIGCPLPEPCFDEQLDIIRYVQKCTLHDIYPEDNACKACLYLMVCPLIRMIHTNPPRYYPVLPKMSEVLGVKK